MHLNIADWAEQHFERFGDYEALVVGDQAWTNGSLHEQSCRLASALVALGVCPGDRVVAATATGREAIVAATATWRCGAVLVFANPSAPADETQRLVADAKPTAIIGPPELVAAIDQTIDHRISLDQLDELIAGHAELVRSVPRAASDIAQLCYTSGTTGAAKASCYTHGSIDASLRLRARTDSSLSVQLLLLKPTAGGANPLKQRWTQKRKLIVLDPFDPERVLSAIELHRVTHITFVPSQAEAVLALPTEGRDLSSLQEIVLTGAKSSTALVLELERRLGVRPTISYAMTEVGAISVTTKNSPPSSAGRPLPGVHIRIVDDEDRDLPVGDTGEIYVKTPWMPIGYWNDPERTAQLFRGGWARTGDRGHLDATGELTITGRSKEIIIQGGFNVAPAEIVEVVAAIPGIAECAVVGMPHRLLGEEVVVCIVRRAEAAVTDGDVLSVCRARLDSRKWPGRVRFVDKIPRTDSGKVKLRELREQLAAEAAVVNTELFHSLEAAGATERVPRVRTLIRDQLLAIVGTKRDDLALDPEVIDERAFAALGLNSLGAVQMIHALGERFGHALSPTLTFRFSTIAALAEHLSSDSSELFSGERAAGSLDLRRTDRTSAPASAGQQYFWYMTRQEQDPTSYASPTILLLEGRLDTDALRDALRATVDRHGVFRTRLHEDNGVLWQVVPPTAEVPLDVELVDRSPLAEPEWRAVWDDAVAEFYARGFDLARGVCMWVRLTRVAPDRHLLIWMLHHIVLDAASGPVLLRELFDDYARRVDGSTTADQQDEPPIQYIDYVDALIRQASTPTGAVKRQAWQDELRDAAPLDLPVDFPRGNERDEVPFGITADAMHYPYFQLRLPDAVRAAVTRTAREHGATPYVVYLAALTKLLHEISRQTDICVENTYSPRGEHRALPRMQGLVTCWLMVRIDASGNPDLGDLIRRTKQVTDRIRDLGPLPDYYSMVPHPIRRAVLNYMLVGNPAVPQKIPGLELSRPARPTWPVWRRPWELHLTMTDTPQATNLVWTGNEKLFRRVTIEEWFNRYLDLLATLA